MADSIGAAAEDESREIVGSGKAVSFGDFFWSFDLEDVAGGTAEAHSGKTRN